MSEELERRGAILEAARLRYSQADPASVSMRQIANDAGVSVALVYHYFKDKDALYDACLDQFYEKLIALGLEWQASFAAGPPEQTLDEIVRRSFRFTCDNRAWVLMIQRMVIEHGGLDGQRREAFQKPFLTVAAQMAAGVTGRPERDVRLALQSLVLLILRHSLSNENEREAFVGPGVSDPIRVVEDHLVDVALRLLLGKFLATET